MPAQFHILHASFKHGNDVFTSLELRLIIAPICKRPRQPKSRLYVRCLGVRLGAPIVVIAGWGVGGWTPRSSVRQQPLKAVIPLCSWSHNSGQGWRARVSEGGSVRDEGQPLLSRSFSPRELMQSRVWQQLSSVRLSDGWFLMCHTTRVAQLLEKYLLFFFSSSFFSPFFLVRFTVRISWALSKVHYAFCR